MLYLNLEQLQNRLLLLEYFKIYLKKMWKKEGVKVRIGYLIYFFEKNCPIKEECEGIEGIDIV